MDAAAMLLAMTAGVTAVAGARQEAALVSPRLEELRRAVSAADRAAADAARTAFWTEVRAAGAPLVEPAGADRPHERLVTFLWQSAADARVLVLADFGDYVPHMTLQRLADTDVWFRTLRLPSDARFLYELSVDDPAYPFTDGAAVGWPSTTRPDPQNPRQYDFAKPQIFSLVELPAAPSLVLSMPDESVPHGTVDERGEVLKSAILGNERKVFFYKPHGYRNSQDPNVGSGPAEPYPLLIFGASYLHQIKLPVILDNLIARRSIPPVVAVFVGFPPSVGGRNVQDEEAGGGPEFGDFVAQELLPWVRERVNVTDDPRRVVIGGASAGGHGAACVALRHPEAIGAVIAQSGAFWRGLGNTARYWGDPAHDEGREGFARLAASQPLAAHDGVPVRFWLTVGRLECGAALSADSVTMLHASRHVRDVLEAKGYAVTLRETSGGHDPYNWEASLPEALEALLGSEAKPPAAELEALQGTWEGFMSDNEAGGKITITITGNSLHFYRDPSFWFETTFTLPPDTDPPQLHATIRRSSPPEDSIGEVVFAIFKIEDGTLTLAGEQASAVEPPNAFPSAPGAGPSFRYDLEKAQPRAKNPK